LKTNQIEKAKLHQILKTQTEIILKNLLFYHEDPTVLDGFSKTLQISLLVPPITKKNIWLKSMLLNGALQWVT
jgi:hypothetical protein